MSEFKNVTIIKKANIYFDGKVTSRTLVLSDGSRKTLGVMLPGKFEFNTEAKEIIEILSGSLEISLPGEDGWRSVNAGDSFEVPAQSKFGIHIKELTDYVCSFE